MKHLKMNIWVIKISQNEYAEASEESNEEDCTEYETRQDRLRSPLIPQEIESGY